MARPELQPGAAGPGSASGLARCPRRSPEAGLRHSTPVPAAPVAGGAAYSTAATRPEADGQRAACALISMTDVASAAVSSRNAAGRPKISPIGALPKPAHLIDEPVRDQLAAVQFRVLIAIGVFRGRRARSRNLTQRRVQLIELHPFLFRCHRRRSGPRRNWTKTKTRMCSRATAPTAPERSATRGKRRGDFALGQLVRRNAPMAAMESSCVVIV